MMQNTLAGNKLHKYKLSA